MRNLVISVKHYDVKRKFIVRIVKATLIIFEFRILRNSQIVAYIIL